LGTQGKRAGVQQSISTYLPHPTLVSALDDSKIGVVVCDRRFRYKALNRSVAEIHNVPMESLLGNSFHQTLGGLAEQVVPIWESVFDTGRTLTHVEISGQLPKRSGVSRFIEKIFPLRDSKGRISQVGGFIIEIKPYRVSETVPLGLTATTMPVTKSQPLAPDRRDQIPLSHREQEVLRLLVEGKSSKEISSVLEISFRTVGTYRARLMLKLGSNSIVDLVRFAIRNRITTV
jgi:DNA-binding CsgD family transcriptional regulator